MFKKVVIFTSFFLVMMLSVNYAKAFIPDDGGGTTYHSCGSSLTNDHVMTYKGTEYCSMGNTDTDYVSFNATDSEFIRISFDSINANLTATLYQYGFNGGTYQGIIATTGVGSADPEFTFYALEGHKYVLIISSENNTSGNYEIRIRNFTPQLIFDTSIDDKITESKYSSIYQNFIKENYVDINKRDGYQHISNNLYYDLLYAYKVDYNIDWWSFKTQQYISVYYNELQLTYETKPDVTEAGANLKAEPILNRVYRINLSRPDGVAINSDTFIIERESDIDTVKLKQYSTFSDVKLSINLMDYDPIDKTFTDKTPKDYFVQSTIEWNYTAKPRITSEEAKDIAIAFLSLTPKLGDAISIYTLGDTLNEALKTDRIDFDDLYDESQMTISQLTFNPIRDYKNDPNTQPLTDSEIISRLYHSLNFDSTGRTDGLYLANHDYIKLEANLNKMPTSVSPDYLEKYETIIGNVDYASKRGLVYSGYFNYLGEPYEWTAEGTYVRYE